MVLVPVFRFQSVFADDGRKLRGEPFSDPLSLHEMPQEWQEKSIIYPPEKTDADLVVSLNQLYFSLFKEFIDAYAAQRSLKIDVQQGTCGITAGMLRKKAGDIGGLCCPPGKTDRLPGVRYHSVGIHPISIIVNKNNPIDDLSLEQVRKIFMGDINNWSMLGWKGGNIRVISRMHCKKRPGHWRLLLDNADLFGVNVRDVGAVEDMFSLVSSVPAAIGYEATLESRFKKGNENIKVLKIGGHDPKNLTNLLKLDYPLYRSLYLSTWETEDNRKPDAQKLVDYIIAQLEMRGEAWGILPLSVLRRAGWTFRDGEIVGEPD